MSAQVLTFPGHPAEQAERMLAASGWCLRAGAGVLLAAGLVLVVGEQVLGPAAAPVAPGSLAIATVLLLVWVLGSPRLERVAAIWAAGARGEQLVADQLAGCKTTTSC